MLKYLIDDILDYSKLHNNTNSISIKPEKFKIKEAIQEVLDI